MKKMLGTTISLAVMAIFVSSAQAINISNASVQSGLAVVSGGKAAANSTISWEGGNVAKANKNGGISYSGNVPADCVGTLSDGVSTIDVALANCTPTPQSTAKVLKTGQTTCYDTSGNAIACPGTGQDGELQKGTARSYTVNVNGLTITDNATGLEWEKLCSGVGCPVINEVNTLYTWAQAFQKIADLNTANFAGHNDWRLPNINELQTRQTTGGLLRPSTLRLIMVWTASRNRFSIGRLLRSWVPRAVGGASASSSAASASAAEAACSGTVRRAASPSARFAGALRIGSFVI